MRTADWWVGFTPQDVQPFLEESQFWSHERLRALQMDRLRKLLEHAGRTVPHYRDLFRSLDFDASKVERPEDLRRLPSLTKADIAARPQRFVSEQARKPLHWLRTAGSTGQPFRFVRTRLAQSYKIASRLRFRRWYGIGRCDPQLLVGGIDPVTGSWSAWLRERLHLIATNRVMLYASDLHGAGFERALRAIERHGVTSIMGYPTGITALAEHCRGRRPLSHPPRAIFTNSETLFDWMRERIRNGLGVAPRADYVASEGSIAHECPEGGLHVDMEEVLVELVPRERESDLASLLVTFLHTHDFPLIRYEIGDVARWAEGPCPCGRGLERLDGLIGRFADAIAMPDGRRFTAANINLRIAHFPFIKNVRQYQIVQEDPDRVELRVLEAPETGPDTVRAFADALAELFAPLSVGAVTLPDLPREKNGKFRPVIGLQERR